MYRLYGTRRAAAMVAALLLILASASLRAGNITDAYWVNGDFIITFPDSVTATLDYIESDSTRVVIRIAGASLPLDSALLNQEGESARIAAITSGADSSVVVSIIGTGRMGYTTVWRPYSHTLWVHTFDWETLDYAEEQYHKGLIALEQGLEKKGEEYLEIACSFGERRAAAILGVRYAMQGKDSLALMVLNAPLDADDYAARTVVFKRLGNTEAASEANENFERFRSQRRTSFPDPTDQEQVEVTRLNSGPNGVSSPSEWLSLKDWRTIALIIIAIIFFIIIIARLSRKNTTKGTKEPQYVSQPKAPASSATQETLATKVATPHVVSTPPVSSPEEQSIEPTTPTELHPSAQAPSVMSPPVVPIRPLEEMPELVSDSHKEKPLPKPDAPPPSPDVDNEVLASSEPEIINEEEKEGTTAPSGEHHTEETPTVDAGGTPAPAAQQRRPGQAEQLRKLMEEAQNEPQQHSKTAIPFPNEEETLNEARRQNVSRDYIELKNKIDELRKKLDDK